VGGDHPRDVGLEDRVVAALLAEKRGTLVRGQRDGGVIEVGESLPTVAHGRASWYRWYESWVSMLRTIQVAIRKAGTEDGRRATASRQLAALRP
jgi:hypothetical protein